MAPSVTQLSDAELLSRLRSLVRDDNRLTAELLVHIAEVEARNLYADAACSSMYVYCETVLGMSLDSANKRIRAARAARRFPVLLDRLAEGRLHLSGIVIIAAHLTDDTALDVIDQACGKTKRELEKMVADLAPKPDVPSRIRKRPQRRDDRPGTSGAPARDEPPADGRADEPSLGPGARAKSHTQGPSRPTDSKRDDRVNPLGAARYAVQFTADQELRDKLEMARDLLSHSVPDGDLAQVVDRAVTLLIDKLMKERFAQRSRRAKDGGEAEPSVIGGSRAIPAEIKRRVLARDGMRCAFVSAQGKRCDATRFLEFHHLDPWAKTQLHSTDNIEIRCRTHNQHAARKDFGAEHIERRIRQSRAKRK